jgi:hypothetical protein
MHERLIGYLAVASGRPPAATPVFFVPFAGRYWAFSRRNTVKASAARTGDGATLLVPDGDRWRLHRGVLTVLDPLRPDLSARSATNAALAPLAASAYMHRNGRALASLWLKRPDLLRAVFTAMKIMYVVEPTTTTDLPARPTDAVYTGWAGDEAIVLPVRRKGDDLIVAHDAEHLLEACEAECAVTSAVESPGEIAATGSIDRGRWEKHEEGISFTTLTRTVWDGTQARPQPVSA